MIQYVITTNKFPNKTTIAQEIALNLDKWDH